MSLKGKVMKRDSAGPTGSRTRGALIGACGVSVLLVLLLAGLWAAHGHAARADASTLAAAYADAKAPRSVNAYVTYYGWYDNTPPGCGTAYSGCAGGTGTYRHPITFASYKGEFPVGTVVYYPTLEKYFVMGDECSECKADWTGKGPDGGPRLHHLDLWIGGKGANEFSAINCEDALTQGLPNGAPLLTPLILNPPGDLPVSSEPIFNSRTNRCFGGARTITTHGRYRNPAARTCIADRGNSDRPGVPAVLRRCNSGAAEDLTFEGAFLSVHNNRLCLHALGSTFGAKLDFARCTGGPFEQWEINTNGTIAWIQYRRCLTDVNGRLEFGRCRARPDNRWVFTSEPPTDR